MQGWLYKKVDVLTCNIYWDTKYLSGNSYAIQSVWSEIYWIVHNINCCSFVCYFCCHQQQNNHDEKDTKLNTRAWFWKKIDLTIIFIKIWNILVAVVIQYTVYGLQYMS